VDSRILFNGLLESSLSLFWSHIRLLSGAAFEMIHMFDAGVKLLVVVGRGVHGWQRIQQSEGRTRTGGGSRKIHVFICFQQEVYHPRSDQFTKVLSIQPRLGKRSAGDWRRQERGEEAVSCISPHCSSTRNRHGKAPRILRYIPPDRGPGNIEAPCTTKYSCGPADSLGITWSTTVPIGRIC